MGYAGEMKVAVFSCKNYDRDRLLLYAEKLSGKESSPLEFSFYDARLREDTAALVRGHEAVCCFVHDEASEAVIRLLADYGIRHIAMRCAGYNNVDLRACERQGITVSRVPSYSPNAVAEHAVGLILELNRKYSRAYNRIRENNF